MDTFTSGTKDKYISEHTFQINKEELEINIKEMKKNQYKIQLGIIIDITSSMQKYIDACKVTINQLLENTKKLFKYIEIGIVGYRDKKDKIQIVIQNFTTLQETIDWTKFEAVGGDDCCEDLPIAFKNMLKLNRKP